MVNMLRGKNLQTTSTIIKFTLFPNMKYFFTPCNLNSLTINTRFFFKIKGILSGHPYLDKLVTGNVSLPSWYSGGVLTALDPELQSLDLTRFCPGLDITGASGVLEQGGGTHEAQMCSLLVRLRRRRLASCQDQHQSVQCARKEN